MRGKDFNGIINVLFGSVLLDIAWKLNLLKTFTYSKFLVFDLILLQAAIYVSRHELGSFKVF